MKEDKELKKTWKITSWNLNGIRSAVNKGLNEWVENHKPDCMCVQELKAQIGDLQRENLLAFGELKGYFHTAQKKGYSGVGIYTKKDPTNVVVGFDGEEFDAEGRLIELQFDYSAGKFSVLSAYFPSGSSGEDRQLAKYRFLEKVGAYLAELRKGRSVVMCGDLNIAHKEIDLKNWKGNLKNSGFLPEEREWMTKFLESGWEDVYRKINPMTQEDCYTWWSNRGAAYAKNVGWRIDYQLATPEIANAAKKTSIFKDKKLSDHAPLTIEYEIGF
jgi:exodeoxyribonuclease-3